jgi:hypothetical protein
VFHTLRKSPRGGRFSRLDQLRERSRLERTSQMAMEFQIEGVREKCLCSAVERLYRKPYPFAVTQI